MRLTAVLTLVGALASPLVAAQAETTKKPHIIVIWGDDIKGYWRMPV